ncbi:hypothetical protein LG325_09925 [Marinobacter nauticus]
MEPIRPDDDELRTRAPVGGADKKESDTVKKKGPKGGSGRDSGSSDVVASDAGGGSGSHTPVGLWLLLLVVALGAGAGWYLQHERINELQAQLEETDQWARQSKLALARFEGDLSETGESLQERGASLEDQIAANAGRLDTADSEIRKLWAIANERNKQRLDDHQQRLTELSGKLTENSKAVADVKTALEQTRSSLAGDLEQLRQRLSGAVAELEQADQGMATELAALQEQMAGVGEQVDSRLQRFAREQQLTIDGLDSRIASLEKQVDALAGDQRVQVLRNELNQLKETVRAIDASRSQLTSRLVRLSEEVNQLRSQ